MKSIDLASFDPAYGSAKLTIDRKGNVRLTGETADGVALKGTTFLMLDDDDYHVIAVMPYYDKKSRNVYSAELCWQPIFDQGGNVLDWECCDHALRVYPFEWGPCKRRGVTFGFAVWHVALSASTHSRNMA